MLRELKSLTVDGVALKKLTIEGVPVWQAAQEAAYTNLVPASIDTDGSIFNGGLGYLVGYRLSSSGATKEAAYNAVTGFIPAKAGDVVRITGCGWYHQNAGNYLCAYKADFTFLGAVTSSGVTYSTKVWDSVSIDGVLATVTLADVADIAYIRASAASDAAYEYDQGLELGADMVVTVNEEIG